MTNTLQAWSKDCNIRWSALQRGTFIGRALVERAPDKEVELEGLIELMNKLQETSKEVMLKLKLNTPDGLRNYQCLEAMVNVVKYISEELKRARRAQYIEKYKKEDEAREERAEDWVMED